MNQQEKINDYLWRYGYMYAPGVSEIKDVTFGSAVDDNCPKEFRELGIDDPARVAMLKAAQEFRYDDYQKCGVKHYGRQVVVDGKPGRATYDLVEMERCGCPDFGPNVVGAIGSGPWKSCHDVGNFHAAHFRFTNTPPSHLNGKYDDKHTFFQEALRRTREAYRKIGLLLYFSGPGTGDLFLPENESVVQSNCSFVNSSNGWIGLAIVGNNSLSCSSPAIWARFLSTFAGGSGADSKVHGWHLLLAHEFGHNCGLGHTSGGIMNPSLNTSSNGEWVGDVAEGWMSARFGGVPVPIGPGPGPGPDPDPDDPPECIKTLLNIIIWVIKNWKSKP